MVPGSISGRGGMGHLDEWVASVGRWGAVLLGGPCRASSEPSHQGWDSRALVFWGRGLVLVCGVLNPTLHYVQLRRGSREAGRRPVSPHSRRTHSVPHSRPDVAQPQPGSGLPLLPGVSSPSGAHGRPVSNACSLCQQLFFEHRPCAGPCPCCWPPDALARVSPATFSRPPLPSILEFLVLLCLPRSH